MSQPATPTVTGATPAAGATPAGTTEGSQNQQPTGATPAASTTQQPQPATGEEALGESGKAILREARRQTKEAEDRAKAFETELSTLKSAGQTEAEKAQAAAVKEAEQRVSQQFEARIRSSEVRRALTAAGIGESELGLAAMAPEFAKLKVGDDGAIDKLNDTVTAFKAAHPSLFAKPGGQAPDYGAGVRPGSATLTRADLERMSEAEINARWPEVQQALATAR
jgi:flagellar biosynthesis GTPase FlhF